MIKDIDMGNFDRAMDRELKQRVNRMSNSICMAYLIEMLASKVDAGPVRKLLVELHQSAPDTALQDADTVYICHVQFDFDLFKRGTYEARCEMLLSTLHTGMLRLCEALHLDKAVFEQAHDAVRACHFVYRYRKGKPVLNKKADLSAELGILSTPASERVVAYVSRISSAEDCGTVTFIEDAQPDLHFQARYLGKLKWLSADVLQLTPKDPSLAPIEGPLSGAQTPWVH
ncbi:hypothetical protein [Aquabacterium sp.]|uniref:hypothetical protein n=1 Tax=Aquabacterium sp. TaxID=1872578 RepID=UPI0040384F43